MMTLSILLAAALAILLALPSALWARLRVSIAFLWRHGYFPSLTRPRCYNEWVQWRKLKDRDAGLALLTDKLHAKSLASERIGRSFVLPTLWHGDHLPRDAAWPMPFIVKANHGCRQFVVVRCEDDWRLAHRLAPQWLGAAYGKWLDEWHYGSAERTLLIEPFIGPEDGLPIDYKVYVFGGRADFIQVHLDRHANHRWVQFDRDWRQLSASAGEEQISPPSCLPMMLDAAERIAGNRDHLRIDFYEVEGRLWFGELCLFAGSGLDRFDPVSLDIVFGACWSKARASANEGWPPPLGESRRPCHGPIWPNTPLTFPLV